MKFKQKTLIGFAGFAWLLIGTSLLLLGLRFVMESVYNPTLSNHPHSFSLLQFLSRFTSDPQNGVVILLALALLIGFIKGRFVLSKTVQRQVNRILTLPNPAHIKQLYTKGYYLLIALMIALGISMRFFPITLDTRGFIDTAIGAALMNGAMLYFRSAINYNHIKKKGL